MTARTARVTRDTRETQIRVELNLDGSGQSRFQTGVPFLDHMLDQVSEFFQGFVNHAKLSLHIDNLRGRNAHHIIETVFKAFGRALRMAASRDERLGDVMPSTKGTL